METWLFTKTIDKGLNRHQRSSFLAIVHQYRAFDLSQLLDAPGPRCPPACLEEEIVRSEAIAWVIEKGPFALSRQVRVTTSMFLQAHLRLVRNTPKIRISERLPMPFMLRRLPVLR